MNLAFHEGKNVGDAINPVIFKRFLGCEPSGADDGVNLLGIGSVIGLKAGLSGRKVVFSSGWADDAECYGLLPKLGGDWDIRCVRGPLTAEALGLSESVAVVDGAYLIEKIWRRSALSVLGRVGFIPHHRSLDFYDWAGICDEAGVEFLDVRLEPKLFMERLWRCERVVTEAMHGAIFADAYGIPWLAIRLYGHINEFKWRDWWASVGIAPKSFRAPALLHSAEFMSALIESREVPRLFSMLGARAVIWVRRRKVIRWLRQIMHSEFHLSDREVLASRVKELEVRLSRLKSDYGPLSS